MMNKLALAVLLGLISIALATPIQQTEIRELSKLKPCIKNQPGTRVKHPSNDHKFLRCVSRDSFWIETCPDNLFYNGELDLCDWNTISLTTTARTDLDGVRFRPVLFRNNKTVHFHGRAHHHKRPLDLNRVSVKITPDTEMFPDQEDIIDTLTPSRKHFKAVQPKAFTTLNPVQSNFGNAGHSFSRFNNVNDEHFDEEKEEEEEEEEMETTTRRPIRIRPSIRKTTPRMRTTTTTTTERPTTTTTERPVIRRPVIRVRTTTERPVFIEHEKHEEMEQRRRPVEHKFVEIEEEEKPRHFETEKHEKMEQRRRPVEHKFVEIEEEEKPRHFEHDNKVEADEVEHRHRHRQHHHDDEEIFEEEEEENKDKPVLFRKNHVVVVTKPTFVARRRPVVHRRPVEEIPVEQEEFIEEPVDKEEKFFEEVPVRHQQHAEMEEQPEFVREEETFTTERTPVRTTTHRTFEKLHPKTRTQLFKKLADEIPGARVVSFNGKAV